MTPKKGPAYLSPTYAPQVMLVLHMLSMTRLLERVLELGLTEGFNDLEGEIREDLDRGAKVMKAWQLFPQ